MTVQSITLQKTNYDFRLTTFRFIAFFVILFWCAGFTFPALFHSSISTVFNPLLREIYSGFCHQKSERTFTLLGSDLLVCARCSGIYIGALLSAFIALIVTINLNKNKVLLYISFLPIVLDVLFYSIGLYTYSKELAFITGLICGSILTAYVIEDLERMLFKKEFIK